MAIETTFGEFLGKFGGKCQKIFLRQSAHGYVCYVKWPSSWLFIIFGKIWDKVPEIFLKSELTTAFAWQNGHSADFWEFSGNLTGAAKDFSEFSSRLYLLRQMDIHYYNTLLQHTTATHYCNTLLQHICYARWTYTTTTHYSNTLLQHTTATHYCNTFAMPDGHTLLQHTTATHYCNTLLQHTTAWTPRHPVEASSLWDRAHCNTLQHKNSQMPALWGIHPRCEKPHCGRPRTCRLP